MSQDVLLQRLEDRGVWDLVRGADGDVVTSDSEMCSVLSQLLDHAPSPGHGGWVWDDRGTYGSLLYLIAEDTPAQRDAFVAYALTALQVLVEAGMIRDVTAEVRSTRPGRLDGVINWRTPSGQAQSITTPLIFS